MKKIVYFIAITSFLGLFACSANQEDKASDVMYSLTEEEGVLNSFDDESTGKNEEQKVNSEIEITDRKLIKTGDISFETEELLATKKNILTAIKKYKGYVSTDNETKQYGSINYSISVRIPSINFDKLIDEISIGVEEFDQKNIYVQDVTEEFLDVEARIKTKKELEQRYIKILNKANTVSEILNIERQIGELRTDIERFEGRLKYLKSQISFSTLNINFYKTLSTETKFGKEFSNGMDSGWDNLIWFFVALTYVWPFLIIAIFVVFFIVRYERRKKKALK
jgi:hypothetical protein